MGFVKRASGLRSEIVGNRNAHRNGFQAQFLPVNPPNQQLCQGACFARIPPIVCVDS